MEQKTRYFAVDLSIVSPKGDVAQMYGFPKVASSLSAVIERELSPSKDGYVVKNMRIEEESTGIY